MADTANDGAVPFQIGHSSSIPTGWTTLGSVGMESSDLLSREWLSAWVMIHSFDPIPGVTGYRM